MHLALSKVPLEVQGHGALTEGSGRTLQDVVGERDGSKRAEGGGRRGGSSRGDVSHAAICGRDALSLTAPESRARFAPGSYGRFLIIKPFRPIEKRYGKFRDAEWYCSGEYIVYGVILTGIKFCRYYLGYQVGRWKC